MNVQGRTLLRSIGFAALLASATAHGADRSWEEEYQGPDATGDHVIALWQFSKEAPGKDRSGRGHTLNLRGRSRIVADGRFGACLECFSSGADNDVVAGAATKYKPVGLTPAGAFTIEMWIKPKPEFAKRKEARILDKMYVSYKHKTAVCQRDYMLRLSNQKGGKTALVATLGFGDAVASYNSTPIVLKPDGWRHITFTYDGAGTGCFYVDGESIGRSTHKDRGAVTAGPYALAVGDRVGSTYAGFPGFIDQVRITNRVERFASGEVGVNAPNR